MSCGTAPELDAALARVTDGAAVFAVWAASGEPWVGRAGNLRRRLMRLLRERQQPSRMLNLRAVAERVEYWPTASRLESWLTFYECAKRYLPTTYPELLKLRPPTVLRLLEANAFPRTQVAARLTGPGLAFGPFRSRAAADLFEHGVLDLFRIRRCTEELQPSPDHPGCVYGEMGMCLRPCQTVVTQNEYASEAARVAEFLQTGGRCARDSAVAARDRLSEEMEFEAAAREHDRVEKIDALLRGKDDLARDVSRLIGVAVQPSVRPGCAILWFLIGGVWQEPVEFAATPEGEPVPVDRRLREIVQNLKPRETPAPKEREEHLSILARWYWSSWRDGIWISAESVERLSLRRMASAVSKVVHRQDLAASPDTGNAQ